MEVFPLKQTYSTSIILNTNTGIPHLVMLIGSNKTER
jgi:hypothetical protein